MNDGTWGDVYPINVEDVVAYQHTGYCIRAVVDGGVPQTIQDTEQNSLLTI